MDDNNIIMLDGGMGQELIHRSKKNQIVFGPPEF